MAWDEAALRILPGEIRVLFAGALVELFFLRRNIRPFVSLIVFTQILILRTYYLGLNVKVVVLGYIIIIQLRHAGALD